MNPGLLIPQLIGSVESWLAPIVSAVAGTIRLAALSTSTLVAQSEPYVSAAFGKRDYHNQTNLHPLGMVVLLTMIGLTFFVKRRWAWLPLFLLVCSVPTAQRVIIATIDFNLVRILIVASAARIFLFNEYRGIKVTRVDKLVIAWALSGVATYSLLRGTTGAFIYQTGVAADMLGTYIVLRVWIRDWSDVDRIARVAAILAMVLSAFFLYENLTRRNLFSIFGGVPAITPERGGRLRCQGPFVHPILAGVFWVGLLPLIASLWFRKPGKPILAIGGVLACMIITVATSSSTPVMGVAAAMLGAGMWIFRYQLGLIRWSIAGLLLCLHMVMEKPVWHLISRVSAVGGSTGHHRYSLINNCITRWDEWFVLGVRSTAHWGHFQFDLANQYVKEAVRGGILGITLFSLTIVLTFGLYGKQWRKVKRHRYRRMQTWGIGVGLFAHCLMFISSSISHSQQNMLVWFLLIAIPVSLRQWGALKQAPRPAQVVLAASEDEAEDATLGGASA